MLDNKMAVGGGSGHKSFLHHDTYSGLWRRDLVLNTSESIITQSSSSINGSGAVRLTSVRHKREDSDDIRSDTSSDNLIDDNDDSDSNNPGLVEMKDCFENLTLLW